MRLVRYVLTPLFVVVLVVGSSLTASAGQRHRLIPASIMRKVDRVHVCEEGQAGWHVDGPIYFGGLGWLAATWQRYRAPSFPASMADATPEQQAWAMAHLVGSLFHGWWPDQAGCTGGY